MRRHEWWQLAGLVACAVTIPLLVGGPWSFLLALLVIPSLLIGRRSTGLRPALVAFALGLLVQLLVAWLREPGSIVSEWVHYLLHDLVVLLIPWWIGRVLQLKRLRRSKEEAIIADLARTRERTRIAEDMHDVLGHDLALIALHSGALELLPESTDEQRRAAAQIRERAVSATDRLHEILGVLRTGDVLSGEEPGDRRSPEGFGLYRIVDRARESGMEVTITPNGPAWGRHTPASSRRSSADVIIPASSRRSSAEATVPAEATVRAVERVVQEALTNAAKHAPGAPVDIELGTTADETRVSVTNGPRGSREGYAEARGGGMGLTAAQERVRLLGGTLTAGPHLGGFRVEARIPSNPNGTVSKGQSDPEAEQRLRTLHRSIRANLGRAALVPAVCAVLVLGAFAVFHVLTFTSLALPSQDFAQIEVGDDRSEVAGLLPPSSIPVDRLPDAIEVPPVPEAGRCEFFLARDSLVDLGGDVHRICTADGVIITADRLTPGGR
ncbi:histidine kinase [Brevibacterium sp.]|uniref:sensor histidine kinase n=1 Tax=Brevibacterium sp. TaxID=1701 RepID=UPI002811E19D|nr:histidine kinase [Brevibacterium sp.]